MLFAYAQISRIKYDGLPDLERAFNRASIVLLSKQSIIPNDMAVAISPNAAIIAGRAPLQSKPPLPWSDAYHATVEAGLPTVRIPVRTLSCVKKYELPFDERWDLDSYARRDRIKQGNTDGMFLDEVYATSNSLTCDTVAAPTDPLPEPDHKNHHYVSSTHPGDVISPIPSHDADDASSSENLDQVETEEAVNGDPLSVENVTGWPAGESANFSA
jgi:hypothetical protein